MLKKCKVFLRKFRGCVFFIHPVRQISVASNAIQIDNEAYRDEILYYLLYCLNCIQRDQNSTYKTGLLPVKVREIVSGSIQNLQGRHIRSISIDTVATPIFNIANTLGTDIL